MPPVLTRSCLEPDSGQCPPPGHRPGDLALDLPELSPGELAVRFTDERKYFVSEHRLLKAHDLITSPAYVVLKAANEFKGDRIGR
jgi:hypothetical protein